jgi:hypothetical protein
LYPLPHLGSKPKHWFERSGGLLLRRQQELVNEHYPGLVFQADSEERLMFLEGDFILEADCGIPTRIRIRIEFPADYPTSEPFAYDIASFFPRDIDRHILSDGQFCLWLPPCSPWDEDDPDRSLLRFLDEVRVFLERQLTYDATGGKEWPGPQCRHGKYGYLDFMLSILGDNEEHFRALFPVILGKVSLGRNEACPCGSQLKYKRCHADRVASILRRVGRNRLIKLFKDSGSRDKAEAKF